MAKKGPAPQFIKIEVKKFNKAYDELVYQLVEAVLAGSVKENGSLHNAIENMLALVTIPAWGDTYAFDCLFTDVNDYKAVVEWLKKERYIDENSKWKHNGNCFSWMLKHIFEQGYAKRFPSAKARQYIAKMDFHKEIKLTDIKRTGNNAGPGIKPNPRRKI